MKIKFLSKEVAFLASLSVSISTIVACAVVMLYTFYKLVLGNGAVLVYEYNKYILYTEFIMINFGIFFMAFLIADSIYIFHKTGKFEFKITFYKSIYKCANCGAEITKDEYETDASLCYDCRPLLDGGE